jgi:hypothetical protein
VLSVLRHSVKGLRGSLRTKNTQPNPFNPVVPLIYPPSHATYNGQIHGTMAMAIRYTTTVSSEPTLTKSTKR